MIRWLMRVKGLLLPLFFALPLAAAEVEGVVGWDETITLSSNASAEVIAVGAAAGQWIKKGELLVQLEDGVLRARLSQTSAELRYQELLRAEAKSELERTEELYDRTLLSDHDLDVARIAHAAAESSYQKARAELRSVQRALALRRVMAPFDAMVLQRQVWVGEMINGRYHSVPLYTLAASATRRVIAEVTSEQATGIRPGEKVELLSGKQRHSGTLQELVWPAPEQGSDVVKIYIQFTPDTEVSIGSAVRVLLP